MSSGLIEPLKADDALLADIRSVPATSSRLDVWWLGQSGFLCAHDGVYLLFDPYLSDSLTAKYANTDKPHVRMSRRTIDPAKLDFIDIVTSTHAHTDHLDAATLNPMLATNPNARFVYARATAEVVKERLRAEVVHVPMNTGEMVKLEEATIHAIAAAHDKIETDAAGNHRYLGFIVELGPFTIYHSGDGVVYDGIVETLRKFKAIDLAILPINGKVGNMNGADAAQLAKAIGAKRMVPCHYHLFKFNTADPSEQFVPECERIGQPYRVLQLGEQPDVDIGANMSKFKIVGINFDHMHMGDLLRQAKANPQVEIAGVSDEQPDRVMPVLDHVGLPRSLFVADYRQLMEKAKPELAILCPATAKHAEWTEKVAPFGSHVLMEKPFAATLADADRMIAALKKTGKTLIINWPLRWYPSHITAKRLCEEVTIGDVIQVHYYDGNRGPLRHVADKVVVPEEIANAHKAKSWWYQKSSGGGSLLDYLGYGTTLGTWFMNGRAPVEIAAMTDTPQGLEVDEHSIAVARYDIPNSGLSKFETRWGAFSDPWAHQPQPKCGFVIVGRKGTISSYDYEPTIRVQTNPESTGDLVPVDKIEPPFDWAINYVAHCLTNNLKIDGPLGVEYARIGQQIVDTAVASAAQKKTLSLLQ